MPDDILVVEPVLVPKVSGESVVHAVAKRYLSSVQGRIDGLAERCSNSS